MQRRCIYSLCYFAKLPFLNHKIYHNQPQFHNNTRNYYINLNAYSSIRYILNSIIIINEWYYYITTSKYELYSNKNDIGNNTIEKVNCIDNKILLIKK